MISGKLATTTIDSVMTIFYATLIISLNAFLLEQTLT